ncbi:hypothetical protein HU200_065076 [Digitaria exilis]|uniref:AN1-type domain-containing protein n=1 Tax=Digitaria exilis TaxID=1010633 RepID=A0A835A0T2_9POAL|nr:hypothetical protein HU200_065076 [Digitaria exilis]
MARRDDTELFPDLGAQCDEAGCNQLDFLPFECDGCGKVFCAAHRTYRDHGCAKAADQGRTVVVCPDCGDSIERAPGHAASEREILDAHVRSRRCDPARKQRKPPQYCPVPRCEEVLTFCNTTQCNGCGLNVCIKHRFPADHGCARAAAGAAEAARLEKEGGCRALAVSIRSFKTCLRAVARVPAAINKAVRSQLRVIRKKTSTGGSGGISSSR